MVKQTTPEEHTQKRILDIIVAQDDVSWKNLIFGLIESEQMDPWDINISRIAQKFLEELKKLQQMDFRIGGKVVLASAILLKLKAERLRDEELSALDRLIQASEEPIDLGLDDLTADEPVGERPKLVPRTPQPRKRKVSVYDLIEALEQALETDALRPVYAPPRTLDTIDPPSHHIDISVIIKEMYDRIYGHYGDEKKAQGSLKFHHLTPSADRRDVVMTFIPLLHLENARKVEMRQPTHFGEIDIHLTDTTPPETAETKKKKDETNVKGQTTLEGKTPKGKKTPPSTTKAKKKTGKQTQLPLEKPAPGKQGHSAQQKSKKKKR
jgi:segregation and condensation protein A